MFCGIAAGPSARYAQVATEVGHTLAARGHDLVYGAGGVGLMGAVARGARAGGSRITGVIPAFLRDREIGDELPEQTVLLVDDLLERKRLMIGRADAFLALPGGYGTLDEVLEVVSMAALGLPVGPLVLVDVADDWTLFQAMVDEIQDRGFARRTPLYHRAGSADEALDIVEDLLPAGRRLLTPGRL
ncbi:amidase [Actinoplanes sp. N902-109]|nr:amidase [Actinoplanes sp. N902-109]